MVFLSQVFLCGYMTMGMVLFIGDIVDLWFEYFVDGRKRGKQEMKEEMGVRWWERKRLCAIICSKMQESVVEILRARGQ